MPRSGDFDAEQRSRRANRRRLVVFLSVFVVLSIVGSIYVFSRPAVYRSTVLLNFVPGTAARGGDDPGAAGGQGASTDAYSIQDEVRYLTSTPLLATVRERLNDAPSLPAAARDGDAAATLQSMLTARRLAGSNVVSVQAEGGEPTFLPLLVDRVVAAYRESLGRRFRSDAAGTAAAARDEVGKLDTNLVAKRREVDAFRARHNIVSLERDENQVLSEVKGVGASLNAANEKVVAAEARLGALQAAEAGGQSVSRARDDPTLAALEQQAAALRGDLRETARTFTPEYMRIDPRIQAQRARLAAIDEQLVAQRRSGQQGALQEARDELAGARAAVAALRRQLAVNQSAVQSFTSRFAEYQALQGEQTHLETLRQKAADRLATLEAGENGRVPKVELVEPASLPQSPSSPLYARDAALAVAASLVVALFAVALVEIFNRPPATPATIVVPQAWSPSDTALLMQAAPPQQALGVDASLPALPGTASPSAQSVAALPPPAQSIGPQSIVPPMPRELMDTEARALLAAAEPDIRVAAALLLTGLTAGEVVAARHADVDAERGTLRVSGDGARVIPAPPVVLSRATSGARSGFGVSDDAPLVRTDSGAPMTIHQVESGLLYAAHDAALDEADTVTSEALRHTYAAFLLRQGVRFAALARRVGPLAPDRLAAYRRLAPPAGSDGTPPDGPPPDDLLPAVRDLQA